MIRSLVESANRMGIADVTWSDGERIRVRYDTLFSSDVNDDKMEECVVDVLKVLVPGPRSLSRMIPGRPGIIRSSDPPLSVIPAPDEITIEI